MTNETKFLLAGAAAPVAVIMTWTYFRDRLREPPHVVAWTMVLGGLASIPIVAAEHFVQGMLGISDTPETIGQALAVSFLVAALVEEFFKLQVLRRYSARHSAFDEPYDGIVYGVAASLGFALVENVMYVLQAHAEGFDAGVSTALARAVLSVPLHAACGSLMGCCIGIGRFSRSPARAGWTIAGFLGAVLLHGTYDTFAFSGGTQEVMALGDERLPFFGCVVTTALGLSVAALAAARIRRDQIRGETNAGAPALPVAALAGSAIGAVMIVGAIAVVLADHGEHAMQLAEDEKFPLTPVSVVAAVGIVIEAVSFIVSLIAVFAVRQWKPASICALLLSGAVVGLVTLAVALGL
jgi:RsiW-degrading membrane proteinase PrsW (M82 family)